MVQPRPVRQFLQGRRGLVESYQACWHGRGVFQERLCVRVDRFPGRCEITAQVLELAESGDWLPAHVQVKPLTPPEWEAVRAWLEEGFWQQPSRDGAAAVMDGDCWRIEGYRRGVYHEVYRHTGSVVDGSGSEVYELGRRLAALAGLRRFEQSEEAGHSAPPA
jgi:hypothetical protein